MNVIAGVSYEKEEKKKKEKDDLMLTKFQRLL